MLGGKHDPVDQMTRMGMLMLILILSIKVIAHVL